MLYFAFQRDFDGKTFIFIACGLPWWASISVLVLGLRTVLTPLVIKAQKNAANMHNNTPGMTVSDCVMKILNRLSICKSKYFFIAILTIIQTIEVSFFGVIFDLILIVLQFCNVQTFEVGYLWHFLRERHSFNLRIRIIT